MIEDIIVYLVTDSKLTLGRSVEYIVKESCKAGISMVQFRDKEVNDEDFVKIGKRLREITSEFNVPLIVNDRVHLVKEIGADGVHIGQEDFGIEYTRHIIGNEKIIGVSVSNVEEALKAVQDNADYIGISGVFKTDTKKDAKFIGLDGLRKIADAVGDRIFKVAIGGIKIDNAKDVILAGADGIAVVTAITMAEDIKTAVIKLKEKVLEGRRML